MRKVFLLRYDTESASQEEMAGFLEKAVIVHRSEGIPASFFCTGSAIDAREQDFRDFYMEVKEDPLFDIQDHSYSHIGVGYSRGQGVDVLKSDYQRSFDAHERVLGRRPVGVTICGTGGKDGPRLRGFDETEKGLEELHMLAALGVRMINSHLVDVDENRQFCSYARAGHPEIMGFPSGYSDTSWMHRRTHGDPMTYICSRIEEHAGEGSHMPLMLHDWVAWNHAPDKELTHVKTIAEHARKKGYELVTHIACRRDKALWENDPA